MEVVFEFESSKSSSKLFMYKPCSLYPVERTDELCENTLKAYYIKNIKQSDSC
jgi:hypothetical protein